MWDSNSLLQLLKSMPNELGKEHLEKIQMLIDADKYKCSLLSGFNLCDMNMYAPFCKGCSKASIYPCAVAYVHMMKAGGLDIELGARPVKGPEQNIFASQPQFEQPDSFVQTVQSEELNEETAVTSTPDNIEVNEEVKAEEPVIGEIPSEELVKEEQVVVEEKESVTEEQVAEEENVTIEEEQSIQQTEDVPEQTDEDVEPKSEPVITTEKRKIRIAVVRKRL